MALPCALFSECAVDDHKQNKDGADFHAPMLLPTFWIWERKSCLTTARVLGYNFVSIKVNLLSIAR